jgi:hypothetical protein
MRPVWLNSLLISVWMVSLFACSRSKPTPIDVEQRPAKLPTETNGEKPKSRNPSADGLGATNNNANQDPGNLNGSQDNSQSDLTGQTPGTGIDQSSNAAPNLNGAGVQPNSQPGPANVGPGAVTPNGTPSQPGQGTAVPPTSGSSRSGATAQRWDGSSDLVEDSGLSLAP